MVNVVVIEFALLNVTLPDVASHRTNLFPGTGVAVSVTVVLLCAAPEFGSAVPREVLFEVTVTWRPKAKFALTDTAPVGIVNVAVVENRFLILAFVKPLGAVSTSQLASAYPDGGLAVIVTVTSRATAIDALAEGVAVTVFVFVALSVAEAPETLFTFRVTAWPVASKTARILTALFGIVKVSGLAVESLRLVTPLEVVVHRTNLCPVSGVAVRLTVEPNGAAPELLTGLAVPIELLLDATVNWWPAANTASIDTLPEEGITNVAFCVKLLAIARLDGVIARQCESAYPADG